MTPEPDTGRPEASRLTPVTRQSDVGRPAARRLSLVPAAKRGAQGGKVIGRTNAGRPTLAGISLPDCRHHIHALGPTGTGKSTLLLRMILDDAEAGRGVAVFDPKGDLIRDVLDRLPASCGDRLVLIDPDEHDHAPPALNLLDPATAQGSPHRAAEHITSVMSKVWSRWWGHRTADIAHHALLTLAHTNGATLTQLPRLLGDRRWRSRVVGRVRAHIGEGTLGEFWDAYEQLTPGERAHVVAPLMAKLRLVLAHPLAVDLFGTPATTFTLADILDGGILLCRLPKGVIGEDGCRLIGSLLLAGLWRATIARATVAEHERLDAAVVVDECHNFLHMPIGLDDALAEARALRVSFVLAHQYLGQLTGEMADAIDANARNKVYFALAPDDAGRYARHVRPWLDDGDLIRLGGFEVVLRPVARGRTIPPCTLDTLPAPDPQPGRAATLRAAARQRTGLDHQHRQALAARHTAASSTVDLRVSGGQVRVPAGPAVGLSLGPSLGPSTDPSVGREHPTERPTAHEGNALPSHGGEDQWTGTDW